MQKISMTVSSLALVLASPALAHPGHGQGGGSNLGLHYLTDPLHVAPVVAVAAALAFALWRRRARSRG